ncbi:phosphohydrolase [Rhizobium sp. Root708]|uniref:HD domain-containing protein n=1 Tax=Rhizobium sp. Root708 TaxID=1736592 RepID=UPI0006F258FA|nr:HD domain-containing protein [Rhizobium sp. Root708]KRB61568.1 phosphohydrolase [Rhizobium sp. Root708]
MSNTSAAALLSGFTGRERLVAQLTFIVEAEKLKTVLRRTRLLDRSRVENDAEHTWELALMASILAEYSRKPIDLSKVLRMLLIHDVVEIDAGDTFAFDKSAVLDQAERELRAAERIFSLLPDDQALEYRGLWDEFEAKETSEARFANAMDRLQPTLHNFLTDGGTWRTPGVTIEDVNRRVAPIAKASGPLGDFIDELLDIAIREGFIAVT